MTSQTVI